MRGGSWNRESRRARASRSSRRGRSAVAGVGSRWVTSGRACHRRSLQPDAGQLGAGIGASSRRRGGRTTVAEPSRRAGPATRSRNATTSSWVRPTKFHHITIDSPNGGPPSSSTRTGSSPALEREPVGPGGHVDQVVGARPACPATSSVAGVDQHAVLEGRRRRRARREAPALEDAARRRAAAWRSGTGERRPSSVPRNTRASNPGRATGSGAWWANAGRRRAARASGSATHSWAPCSTVVAAGRDLRVADPRARRVIRLSSPGRTTAWWPALSRCSISPVKSQLTVCSPVWGCGATAMPPVPRAADRVGAVVVDEAPRPDQGALPRREGYGARSSPAARRAARRAA